MTKSELLINMVLKHEGYYVNDPDDAGKRTYRGVAEAIHRNWEGWKIVDMHEPLKRNQKINSKELDDLVMEIYELDYYQPMKIDRIDSLMLSAHVFCHGVNAGNRNSIKILQKAINKVYGAKLKVDGLIGRLTLEQCNREDRIGELEEMFIDMRKAYYTNLTIKKPTQKKFLNGWMNRVASTTKTIKNTTIRKHNPSGEQNIMVGYVDYGKKSLFSKILDFTISLLKRKL